jgi:hypothetical protein
MSETVIETEPKSVSWVELGWDFASLFFLTMGAIALVYGNWYLGKTDLIVPGFIGLICACYAKIFSLERKLNE